MTPGWKSTTSRYFGISLLFLSVPVGIRTEPGARFRLVAARTSRGRSRQAVLASCPEGEPLERQIHPGGADMDHCPSRMAGPPGLLALRQGGRHMRTIV